jgi:membrane associated rhomboid family serine protease
VLLPTRIAHRYERAPIVTNILAGANILVFVVGGLLWNRLPRGLALDPQAFRPHRLITSAFLHLGFLHLLFNMLFLAVYGRHVEDRIGHLRYLGAYLLCAVGGGLGHRPSGDPRAAVGASGAISGMMGFVFVGAPWAEVEVRIILWMRMTEPSGSRRSGSSSRGSCSRRCWRRSRDSRGRPRVGM